MPTGKFRGVSLSRALLDEIEAFLDEHPETGYVRRGRLTEFVSEAVRRRIEEVKRIYAAETQGSSE